MSKNSKLLNEFTEYCLAHPEMRFWQALNNWTGKSIFIGNRWDEEIEDTFFFEGKTK